MHVASGAFAHYNVMRFPAFDAVTMANSVNVQTRIDPAIREEADVVLRSIGLSISDVMRVMLTRIAREKAVPFELFRPNAKTVAAMREAREGKLKRFNSVGELMADIDEGD